MEENQKGVHDARDEVSGKIASDNTTTSNIVSPTEFSDQNTMMVLESLREVRNKPPPP